ncbi:MAG TPA: response regulator [Bryobacteraceae bacterium]|nr:response regulator [Bryobacteraceae bacterium]HXJ10894.1 response regulator [Candidatus Limnocylindrales bacterium]HXJ37730.1 response regulator [Bryobacteraceae bacterium]
MLFVDKAVQPGNTRPITKRILFVDDEQNILDGLKRTLHSMRSEWQMAFSTNGKDALQKLEEHEFDVIVSDIRMPGMSGPELLTEVLKRYPNIVRIVLSGTVEHDLVLGSATTAHQYLVKPCDAATLRATLDRALCIREILVSPRLRALASRRTSLPSLPSVYTRLVESLQNPEISSRELGQIIAQDVGMTAKVLQIANSAFFGLYRYVASPAEAVVYLGVDTIKALTLSTSVFSAFQQSGLAHGFIEELQRHSIATGVVASIIAKAENAPKKVCDTCLVSGLLHDVGKLVLATECPAEYGLVLAAVRDGAVACHELERQALGATHAEVGAYLLWLWGLPDPVCNAVAFHHRPAESSEAAFAAGTAIHVADALEHEMSGPAEGGCRIDLDTNHLTKLGLTDRLPGWRQISSQYSLKGQQT